MITSPTTTEAGIAEARACATLTIDLSAIAENYRLLRTVAGGAETAAVVKADGYGLGADQVGPALARAGARTFFVAHLEEALRLRAALDAAQPGCVIGVLNGFMAAAGADYARHALQPVLNTLGDLERWKTFNRDRQAALPAMLHVDSGMNRLGLDEGELSRLVERPALLEGIPLSHIISHLACAETPDDPMNARQRARFGDALPRLPKTRASLANSSGIFLGPDYHFDLVRPGVALYGVNPTPAKPNPMRQVIRLQAKILQIRQIDDPQSVGYGAAYRTTGPARTATLGVGYADGYLRSLSDRAVAWVGGKAVPIIGRVSMDLIIIDLTALECDSLRPGDKVDLLAPENGVDQLAAPGGTIGYEVLISLGHRYHRVSQTPPTNLTEAGSCSFSRLSGAPSSVFWPRRGASPCSPPSPYRTACARPFIRV